MKSRPYFASQKAQETIYYTTKKTPNPNNHFASAQQGEIMKKSLLLISMFVFCFPHICAAIDCPETNSQGIVGSICRKCNATTELLDRKSGTCKKKISMKVYTKSVMEKCFACRNIQITRQCIEYHSRAADKITFSEPEYEAIKKHCLLK